MNANNSGNEELLKFKCSKCGQIFGQLADLVQDTRRCQQSVAGPVIPGSNSSIKTGKLGCNVKILTPSTTKSS